MCRPETIRSLLVLALWPSFYCAGSKLRRSRIEGAALPAAINFTGERRGKKDLRIANGECGSDV